MCSYQVLSIIGLFFPGLVVIALWFFDLRKRLDPLTQEIYRQKVLAYREILVALRKLVVAERKPETLKPLRQEVWHTMIDNRLFVDDTVQSAIQDALSFSEHAYWYPPVYPADSAYPALEDMVEAVYEKMVKDLKLKRIVKEIQKLPDIKEEA